MNENVKIVFGLLGGLALFLYGMNGMSDALQKTAGDKMKKICIILAVILIFICNSFNSTRNFGDLGI